MTRLLVNKQTTKWQIKDVTSQRIPNCCLFRGGRDGGEPLLKREGGGGGESKIRREREGKASVVVHHYTYGSEVMHSEI